MLLQGDPFTSMDLVAAWISNYIHHRVWGKITFAYQTFHSFNIEVKEWIRKFIPRDNVCNYVSMQGLKLIHISKMVHPVMLSFCKQLFSPWLGVFL